MKDLRIVFFGTPEFAVESLDRLVTAGYNIVGVVTATDKPAGRGHHMLQSEVKKYAVAHNLPLLQPERLKDEAFVEQLRALRADLHIVIAFRMLPEVVWAMPRLGTFNLHASLLPRYRGAAPINWAIINGDTETGVTTFFLKQEIDTGDIIDQRRIAIEPDDNLGTVYDKLMHLGADMVVETVAHIADGTVTTIPQDSLIAGGEPATPAPKIHSDTCHIDWTKPVHSIHNLVRGLSPYPAAWSTLHSADGTATTVKIFATAPEVTEWLPGTEQYHRPGTIIVRAGQMMVAAANGWLRVDQLQPAGKRRMAAADFMRGNNVAGARFE